MEAPVGAGAFCVAFLMLCDMTMRVNLIFACRQSGIHAYLNYPSVGLGTSIAVVLISRFFGAGDHHIS